MLLLQKIVKRSLHTKFIGVLITVLVLCGNTLLFAPLPVRSQVYFGQVPKSGTNSTGTGHVHNHGPVQPSMAQRTTTFGNKVKAFFGFDANDPYSQPQSPNNIASGGNSAAGNNPATHNSLPPRSGSTGPQNSFTPSSSGAQTTTASTNTGTPSSTNVGPTTGATTPNVSTRLRDMRSNVFDQDTSATARPAPATVVDTRAGSTSSSVSSSSVSSSSLSPPAVSRTLPKLSHVHTTPSSTAGIAGTSTSAGLATTSMAQPTLVLPRPSLAHDVGMEKDDPTASSTTVSSSQMWSLRSSLPAAGQPQRTLTSRPAATDEVAVLPEPFVAVQTTPRTVTSETRPELPPLGNDTEDDQMVPSLPVANLPPVNPQQLSADRRDLSFDAQEEPVKKIPDRNILLSRQSPLLDVEMTGPNRTDVGVEAKYQCRIFNAGGTMAEQVVLVVELPVWATIAGAEVTSGVTDVTLADNDTHLFQWNVRQIAPNDDETLVLRVVPKLSKPIELKVAYDFKRMTTRTIIEVQEPKLEMAIDGPTELLAGVEGVYWLRLRNVGNGDAVNVELALLPAAGDMSEPSRHTIPLVRAGEEQVLEIRAAEKRNDVLDIRVQAAIPNGLRSETVKQVAVLRPQLDIEVESPEFLFAGNQAEYRMKIRNNGTAPTGQAEISVAMPATAKYIMSDQEGRIISGQNTVVWTMDKLSIGSEQVYTLICELHQEGKSELDIVVMEPTAGKVTATAVTQVEAIANVTMKIDTPQGPVEVGKDSPYVVTVTNNGSKTANNIDVRCAFVAAVEPIRIENGSGVINNGMVLFERIGALQPGQSRTFRFVATASKPGAHKIRVEMESATSDTHLVHEGSTLFYQKGRSINGELNIAKPAVSPPPAVPSPLRIDIADRRLTPTAPPSSDIPAPPSRTVPRDEDQPAPNRDDAVFPWPPVDDSVSSLPLSYSSPSSPSSSSSSSAEESSAKIPPRVSTLPANPMR